MAIGFALGAALVLAWALAYRRRLRQANAQLAALSEAARELRGVKHDFYNLLNTYGGYIAVGDMGALKKYHEDLLGVTIAAGDRLDLAERLSENPALIALLLQKAQHAQACGVHLRTTLQGGIGHLPIDTFSLCRVLGNLLDNAIEAAAASPARRAEVRIEPKPDAHIHFVIENTIENDVDVQAITVPGVTTKQGHDGLGLSQAYAALARHPNALLTLSCRDGLFTARIDLAPR